MKNYKIFMRTFLVCIIVGIVFDVLFWSSKNIMLIDIVGELVIDIIFGLSVVTIYKNKQSKMTLEEANCIIKRHSVEVIENDKSIVGKLGKYKSFFMGNFYYDKTSNVLSGPRRFIEQK